MPMPKEVEEQRQNSPKDVWPLYGLQALPTRRFAEVITRVLKDEYKLLGSRRSDQGEKKLSPSM